MKKIKMRIITSCLSLGLVVSTLFTPISVFAQSDPTTQLDGKLSTIYQGSIGDCGAVSAIQALDNSIYGKNLLSKMITVNNDGSYTVKLGSKNQKVSQTDVANAYIEGDLDARVIEAALQNAMKIYNSCFACDVFTTMTGFKQNTLYGDSAKTNMMNTMASNCQSGEGITAACDFNIADPSIGILGDGSHSYSIRWVTNDTVIVINPWNTSELIYMSRSQFEDSIRYMTYVDKVTKKVVVFWD
jgi:hypothetical protein